MQRKQQRDSNAELARLHEKTFLQTREIFTSSLLKDFINSVTKEELDVMYFIDSIEDPETLELLAKKETVSLSSNEAEATKKYMASAVKTTPVSEHLTPDQINILKKRLNLDIKGDILDHHNALYVRATALRLCNKIENVFLPYRSNTACREMIEDEMLGFVSPYRNLYQFAIGKGISGGVPGIKTFIVLNEIPALIDLVGEEERKEILSKSTLK
ncbi:MAG: hypothetical protein GJ680_18595 [Alteromonadaceae bacterium]|nr:hypothetical protein [Alteromonadaceae bacterium]